MWDGETSANLRIIRWIMTSTSVYTVSNSGSVGNWRDPNTTPTSNISPFASTDGRLRIFLFCFMSDRNQRLSV